MVSKEEKRQLLRIARSSIEAKLEGKDYVPDFTDLSDGCFEKSGVYVALVEDNYLKAISGVTEGNKELYQTVQECALNAGFFTSKYKKVVKADLPKLVIEISILGDVKKLDYKTPEELKEKLNSRMGLILKEGMHKQVFLPTMWKMYPDKQDFLDHLCSEAGVQEASWRRVPLNLSYFMAETFAEDDDSDK